MVPNPGADRHGHLSSDERTAIVNEMKTVTNKTRKPLAIPLPRGKTLHLGPGRTAEIAADAATYSPLQKLVAAGDIEVHDEHSHSATGAGGGTAGRTWMPGHGARSSHRGGDR